jgi:hypothetical protein
MFIFFKNASSSPNPSANLQGDEKEAEKKIEIKETEKKDEERKEAERKTAEKTEKNQGMMEEECKKGEVILNHTEKLVDQINELRKAKKAFLQNPLDEGAIDALLDFQYVKFYLSANTDDTVRNGRWIIAVTAHIYFLTKYSSQIPEKKNKLK